VEQPDEFVKLVAAFSANARSTRLRAWYFSETLIRICPIRNLRFDRVTLPNRNFDPKIGAELYHRYLDEWQQAEDLVST